MVPDRAEREDRGTSSPIKELEEIGLLMMEASDAAGEDVLSRATDDVGVADLLSDIPMTF